MFIHVGGDEMVPLRDLVMILDAAAGKGAVNEGFLQTAREEGFWRQVGDGPVKSYVITSHKVIASPISAPTLRKRVEGPYFDMMRSLS